MEGKAARLLSASVTIASACPLMIPDRQRSEDFAINYDRLKI